MRLKPDLTHSRRKARAIFEELRREILAGRFSAGEKLPGSRAIAAELGVARGTVNMALAMLAAEHLIEIHAASGARVSARFEAPARPKKIPNIHLTAWAGRLEELSAPGTPAFFATGQLADEHFPERDWLHALRKSRREYGLLHSGVRLSPAGFLPLRQSIAQHLSYSRGIQASAGNIMIVNGSMQALALICQLLIDEKSSAAFEDPGFHGIRAAIQATGARGEACEIDAEGMILPKRPVRLIFVTPASQFPTGIAMTLERRMELLNYAHLHNTFVVEDEYDSEFTRLKNPPQPLKLLDRDDRVIYVGSFSRTMFASLRIGYALLPDALVTPFLRARRLYDSVPPALTDQMAMAAFMRAGAYRRHLRRMNKIYSERHDLLLQGLIAQLGERFVFKASAAGLSLYARWQGKKADFQRMHEDFQRAGISWQNVERYFAGKAVPAALFGFSHLSSAKIAETLAEIRRILA